MASLGHVAVGLAAGRWYTKNAQVKGIPVRLHRAMLAFTVLSMLPDMDVIGFRFGILYTDPWGHRGASHSFVFAAVVGLICAGLAARDGHRFKTVALLSTAVLASHGILDGFTDGGHGPALWWPFSEARIFWPYNPLPVAPLGRNMLSQRGLYVVLVEALYFLPLLYYALRPRRSVDPKSGPDATVD